MPTTNIYQKLQIVQDKIGQIAKTRENKLQHYKYVGEYDILKELRPLLKEQNLTLTFDDSDEEIKIQEKGKEWMVWFRKQAILTNAEKPEEQITWSADTYTVKYFLQKFFLIPTDDNLDPDANEVEQLYQLYQEKIDPKSPDETTFFQIFDKILSSGKYSATGSTNADNLKSRMTLLKKDDFARVMNYLEKGESHKENLQSAGRKNRWATNKGEYIKKHGKESWDQEAKRRKDAKRYQIEKLKDKLNPRRVKERNKNRRKRRRKAVNKELESNPNPLNLAENLATDPVLNSEQELIKKLVLKGQSLCFTGSAGTGKSFLLRHLITLLQKKYGSNKVGVTSLTGTGASIIGGTTLASYFGLKNDSHLDEDILFKRIISPNFEHAYRNWRRTKVLIIDEISMLDGELFDKLESLSDFCQLPPINAGAKYCFEAQSWSRCVPHIINLTQIYRQKDGWFISYLEDIRLGWLSEQQDGIKPISLFATNQEVNGINEQELKKIHEPPHFFPTHDWEQNPGQLAELTKNCLAVDNLQLKVGTQVMLIFNWHEVKLVNGSQGVVTKFTNNGYPVVKFTDGQDQGQTIERLKVDLSKCFTAGQKSKGLLSVFEYKQKLNDTNEIYPPVGNTEPSRTSSKVNDQKIPKKNTEIKDKDGKIIDKPEIEILDEKRLELDNQIQTLDQEIRTGKGKTEKAQNVYKGYKYLKRRRDDLRDNSDAKMNNHFGKDVGATGKDNLYQLTVNSTNHEITEEQIISVIAQICKGLSTIDQAEFVSKFNVWDTDATNRTNMNNALTRLIADGKEVRGVANKHKTSDGKKNNKTLAETLTKDNTHFETIPIYGKEDDFGIKINPATQHLYKSTIDDKPNKVVDFSVKGGIGANAPTTNVVPNQDLFNNLRTNITTWDENTKTWQFDGTTYCGLEFTGNLESVNEVLDELKVQKDLEVQEVVLTNREIGKKQFEKSRKETERNNLDTKIQQLITDEITAKQTTLTNYKITDGFEDKTGETNGKDNRRTSDDLTKIKELLEDIRFLENADTSQNSSNDDENTVYSKLEALVNDFQKSKIFKFITVEGTTKKLIKFTDKQQAEFNAIKIASGQKEDPTDTLTTYQTKLKTLNPLLDETQVLSDGKLNDKFKEVMIKKDVELTDLAQLFKKKKAKEIITMIRRWEYDQETDNDKKSKTVKIIKMNMSKKPKDADPTDEEITTGLYKLAVGEYSQKRGIATITAVVIAVAYYFLHQKCPKCGIITYFANKKQHDEMWLGVCVVCALTGDNLYELEEGDYEVENKSQIVKELREILNNQPTLDSELLNLSTPLCLAELLTKLLGINEVQAGKIIYDACIGVGALSSKVDTNKHVLIGDDKELEYLKLAQANNLDAILFNHDTFACQKTVPCYEHLISQKRENQLDEQEIKREYDRINTLNLSDEQIKEMLEKQESELRQKCL
ncbi:11437_t:CDS:10, partial [Gigaspora margarita]